jgi:PAS domain S-box-containing protein
LKGKRWIDTIIPEKLREHMEDIGRKILDGKIIENHENEVLRKDGNSVYVLWNNTMIFDRNEKPLYIVSMGIDATQRREVEDKLESNFKVIKDYNKKT